MLQTDFPNQDVRSLDATLDHTYKIEDVMRRSLVTVTTKTTIGGAAKILGMGEVHSLPVIEGETLAGIVTSSDLIRYLAELTKSECCLQEAPITWLTRDLGVTINPSVFGLGVVMGARAYVLVSMAAEGARLALVLALAANGIVAPC